MKEQDDIKRLDAAMHEPSRLTLNSPQFTKGSEFETLGQASSDLIARLGKRVKVTNLGGTQPPSKTTQEGGSNVIYLNFNRHENRNK